MSRWRLDDPEPARYEGNDHRQGYRSGHYSRNLTTTSRDVTLKGISFETAIIERYRRRESNMGRGSHRDVPDQRIRPACRGHYRGTVGQQEIHVAPGGCR